MDISYNTNDVVPKISQFDDDNYFLENNYPSTPIDVMWEGNDSKNIDYQYDQFGLIDDCVLLKQNNQQLYQDDNNLIFEDFRDFVEPSTEVFKRECENPIQITTVTHQEDECDVIRTPIDGKVLVGNKVMGLLLPTVPTKLSQLENDEGFIDESKIGTPNGVASLDENGKVPLSQLPNSQKDGVKDVQVNGESVVDDDVAYITVPTKTSQLENDENYATKSEIPTEISDLNNDVGFITSSDIPTNISAFNNDAGYITSADVPTKVSQLQNDSGYITQSAIPTNVSAFTNDAGYAVASTLATVATSGNYTDLLNKPTIPTNADYVDLTTAQEIDGQKDFNIVPRVKIDGEHPREGLPNTYTQLQYVESNGSQYIDTGYIISTSTDIVEMTFECIGTTIYKWLFGEHDNNARFGLGVGDGANKRNVAYGSTTYKVNDVLFYNSLHNFRADSTGVFIDNNKIANYSNFSSTSTLALFCLNNDGFVNGTAARIQSYKHTRNGVALIDLVPVIRNSDDKAGFYDFVSESFVGSATSTDLIPGPGLPGPHYENLLTDANFASVAFSGSYNDLSNTPTTISSFTNDVGYITSSYHDSTKANQSALNDVTAKIPSEASSSNQLADKNFVNSSIQTATATFLGTYDSIAEIEALTADDNDYAFYRHTDSAGNTLFDRYKYNGTTWLYEYTLNNSSFTSDQWAAINSGVSLGEWVDKSTSQVISGQKDFNTVPRVKVTHETHNLPSSYQEVEYIELTGTQYIDTGIPGTLNSQILIQYQTTNRNVNNHGIILGSRESATSKNISFTTNGSSDGVSCSSNIIDFGNYTITRLTTQVIFGHWLEAYTDKTYRYVKDLNQNLIVASNTASYNTSFTTPTNLLIGKPGSGYVSSHTNFVGYIKYCEIWNNDTLDRKLVPCYRISDDKPGMYDLANDVFYTNNGTGEFGVGPNVVPITYESLLTDATFAPVAFSGSYIDLTNKPTIPTVNDATLTIQKNGTQVGTFTANAASNKTINITVPTDNDINTLIDTYMQSHYDNGDTEVY